MATAAKARRRSVLLLFFINVRSILTVWPDLVRARGHPCRLPQHTSTHTKEIEPTVCKLTEKICFVAFDFRRGRECLGVAGGRVASSLTVRLRFVRATAARCLFVLWLVGLVRSVS